MAELLVWTEDKLQQSDKNYGVSYHAGDVIAVCPDGWAWSRREREHPQWVILTSPGVDPASLETLTAPKISDTAGLQLKRERHLDKATNQIMADALSAGARAVMLETEEEKAAFTESVKAKPFVDFQVVIG